jgi:hypothetical protein
VIRAIGVTLIGCALASCGVTPIVDYKGMSAEQIRELVKDKAMAGNCIVANTPYGRGVTTYLAVDKSVVSNGGSISVDEQCKWTFTQGTGGAR